MKDPSILCQATYGFVLVSAHFRGPTAWLECVISTALVESLLGGATIAAFRAGRALRQGEPGSRCLTRGGATQVPASALAGDLGMIR